MALRAGPETLIKEFENSDIIILQDTWNSGDMSTGCPLGYRKVIFPIYQTEKYKPRQRFRRDSDLVQDEPHTLNRITQKSFQFGSK